MTIAHRRHGGDVRVGVTLGHLAHRHHPLYLLLPLLFKVLELLLRELVALLVKCLPGLVLIVLLPLGLGQELLVADHSILVGVRLLKHVLPHPLHLLLPLPHVVLGRVLVVDFVQFLFEERLHLKARKS